MINYCNCNYDVESYIQRRCPDACAVYRGKGIGCRIKGKTLFYQTPVGVYMKTHVYGLPKPELCTNEASFHGFHIHEYGNCNTCDPLKPFDEAGGHYNPTNHQVHPHHSGDLPPLMANHRHRRGEAISHFLTDRFCLRDIIGRSIIIHLDKDDFSSNPSGHSGPRLACAIIR